MSIYAPHPPLIGDLTLYRVEFGSDGYDDRARTEVRELADANTAGSARPDGTHAVLLDLDVPAWLIPSSTEGHAHLYVDVRCSWRDYKRFLKASAKAGLIEQGYADASIRRGHSALRLPWVRKKANETAGSPGAWYR